MIVNTLIGKDGRLGNQLFQYAAAKAKALDLKTDLGMFSNFEDFEFHGQKCLLKNFNIKYKEITQEDLIKIKYRFLDLSPQQLTLEESLYEFSKVPDNCCLFGHFESELFFINHKESILQELILPDKIEKKAKAILSNYKNPIIFHFRMGDNMVNQKMISGMFEIFTQTFKIIPKDSDIIFIGGGARNLGSSLDNEEKLIIKSYFKDYNIYDHSSEDPLLDLELMKYSYGNVIGTDTTFGWWGCYRNTTSNFILYPKKNVIAPEKSWILI